MFVGTKQILTTHLDLSRNELDDGDCILIADVLLYKQTMQFLDLSYNRVGARGMIRLCKAMKGHEHLKVLYMQHNRIGPAVGREMGVWLKNCQSIEVLDMSANRMGELIQYPTSIERQRIKSAVRDIMQGVRNNRSLQMLDLSYNHLGPTCAGECLSVFGAMVIALWDWGGIGPAMSDSLCSLGLALSSILFSVPYHVFTIPYTH